MAQNAMRTVPYFNIFLMMRTALLFFCMLGFIAAEVQAAPAAATTRPVHRRKPTAGNYTPVYRLYRGHSRRKKGFFGLFKHRSKARHSSAASPKSKGRRGTL